MPTLCINKNLFEKKMSICVNFEKFNIRFYKNTVRDGKKMGMFEISTKQYKVLKKKIRKFSKSVFSRAFYTMSISIIF